MNLIFSTLRIKMPSKKRNVIMYYIYFRIKLVHKHYALKCYVETNNL